MKKEKDENKYWCKSTLINRGWTNSLIKKFLPTEDKTANNPHYKKAAPMKLYLEDRVLKIEKEDEFIKEKEKSSVRSKKMLEVADIRREKLIGYAENVTIELPDKTYEELLEPAIRQYNFFHEFNNSHATKDSDEAFLKRICINYIRHQCTKYEDELEKMFGHVGIEEAHDILQTRINDAIKDKYEELC